MENLFIFFNEIFLKNAYLLMISIFIWFVYFNGRSWTFHEVYTKQLKILV